MLDEKLKINIESKYQNNIQQEILNKSYSNIGEIVKSVKNPPRKEIVAHFR